MSQLKHIILLAAVVFFTLQTSVYAEEGRSEETDLRVLIDISGSMKENDPKNLRVPALKLLVGLLPENVQAGVWTFGTDVKTLLKHQNASSKWKKRAQSASSKITSEDLYTDIEQALKTVIKDWAEDANANRNIILLTDGMVDLAEGEEASDDSRARILTDLLDQLKARNVTVHTIALSETADQELLDALALGTDGWAEQVSDADQLQRIFLRMFEKSAPQDTVPLQDNKFTIDSSIEEFTLLVFKTDSEKVTTVTQPDGNQFSAENAPEDAIWYQEMSYDLLTVTTPQPGEWSIDADVDPDNRVMVVTNLKLNTSEFPNSVFMGENYDFHIWLSSEGKAISEDDFYDVLSIDLLQEANGSVQEIWSLTERDQEQKFLQKIGEGLETGRVSLRIIVDGKTFQREKIHTLEVYDEPVKISPKADVKHNQQHQHLIKIKPVEDLVHGDSMNIQAKITKPDGSTEESRAGAALMGSEWLVEIKDPMPGEYAVVLHIQADGKHGRKVDFTTETYRLGDRLPDQIVVEEEQEETAEPEPITEESEEPIEEPEAEVEEEPSVDWMKIGLYVGGANLIIGLIGFAAWIFIRKRRRMMAEPGEEL